MQRQLSEAGLPLEPASLSALTQGNYRPQDNRRTEKKTEEVTQAAAADDLPFDPPSDIQIDPETGKYIGRVKWYNTKKGYGFIIRGGGEEIFFHKSGASHDPMKFDEGEWVLYDVEDTHKGPEATDVEPYQNEEAFS
ncbi:MAG: cold shock domain-containing protein [Ardenticatenaceae bacterium]|nr:cold shock domain-containing protein [Ardenticatenaceae bacterium]